MSYIFTTKQCHACFIREMWFVDCSCYTLADERLAVLLFGVYLLLHCKYMGLELFQWEVLTFIENFFAMFKVVVFLYSDAVV